MVDSAESTPRKRRSVEERLAAAKASEERAAARLERKRIQRQKYEAVQKQQDRKRDTRRKIVAGAIALETMKRNPSFAAAFRDLLDQHVSRDEDRVLFGLNAHPVPPIMPEVAPISAPPVPATIVTPIAVSGRGGARFVGQATYAPLRDPAGFMQKLGTK